jgi:hypothetical protein
VIEVFAEQKMSRGPSNNQAWNPYTGRAVRIGCGVFSDLLKRGCKWDGRALIKPLVRGQPDPDGSGSIASNVNVRTIVLGSQTPFAGHRSWQDLRWNGYRLVPEDVFTPEPANLIAWPFNTSNSPEVRPSIRPSITTILVAVGSNTYQAALRLVSFDETTSSFVIPENINPSDYWYVSRSDLMEPVEIAPTPVVILTLPRGDAFPVMEAPRFYPHPTWTPPVPTLRRAPPASIASVIRKEIQFIQSHLIKISLFLPNENRGKQLETITDVLITWGNEILPIACTIPPETTCPVCEEHSDDMVRCLNGHLTCTNCYTQLLQVRCPICRCTELLKCATETPEAPLSSLYTTDEQLSAIIHRMSAMTLRSDGHPALSLPSM